jgi:hypothetical protein
VRTVEKTSEIDPDSSAHDLGFTSTLADRVIQKPTEFRNILGSRKKTSVRAARVKGVANYATVTDSGVLG